MLKDIPDFKNRQLAVGKCDKCGAYVVSLVEERIADNVLYTDNKMNAEKALKVLKREAKRTLNRLYITNNRSLNGWIYGHNVQIRNKKGKVTQLRQYASDFKDKRQIVKKIVV